MATKYCITMRIKHKFNAKRVETTDYKFDSKLEHAYYMHLRLLQKAKEVVFFLRQVPMHLPGNVRYVVDFEVFWADGRVTFDDVKGYPTSEFKLKKKLVESLYPLEIRVITRGMF